MDVGRPRHKAAIVIGAAMRVGMGSARILMQEGSRTALFESDVRRIETLPEVPGSSAFKVDIGDVDAVARCSRGAAAEFRPIDLLVDDAGVLRAMAVTG